MVLLLNMACVSLGYDEYRLFLGDNELVDQVAELSRGGERCLFVLRHRASDSLGIDLAVGILSSRFRSGQETISGSTVFPTRR